MPYSLLAPDRRWWIISAGSTLEGTVRESADAADRTTYELSPSVPGVSIRDAGDAADRAEYDLTTTFVMTVRESADVVDRATNSPFGSTVTLSYAVRETADASDATPVSSAGVFGSLPQDGDTIAILTHIYDYFGPGQDWAFSDVRRTAPAHDHAGRVSSWGTSTREIPIPAGPPRLGRLTIEFDDTPDPITGIQFFRSQFGDRTPKGKRVDIRIGPADGKESLFQIPAGGIIEHATFPPGKMRLEVPDVRKKWLQKPLPGLINDRNFLNLPPGVKDGFSKFVLGEVVSQGLGAQGALPCVHVDTVLHQYDGARHRIVDATVYTKTPEETEFAFTTYSYSLVEEEKTIDGLDYTFTFIQFDSALPEGTEVRADIRGLPGIGGWGTVPAGATDSESRNVIDQAVSLMYYVDSLEKGRVRDFAEAFADWDVPSLATVREQFEDKEWLSDYAITEPLTPEVILTHLFGTFMIHSFPNRFAKTKVVMTTEEPPDDAPIFGDFHSILEQSETAELAQDTRNRIHYNFAKIHEGTGRFAGHGTYDNETDQGNLKDSDGEPIIEAEEVDLHACRDEDVALLLAVEWSTWRDQDAHRFHFELDMPSKLTQVDLARDFLVTHYGGLAEGGWNRARFIPYRITDDYERLKFKISAIRKPNASILIPQAADTGGWKKNSRVSLSYLAGNKTLFKVLADTTGDSRKMVAFRTDDEGVFEAFDGSAFPTLANPIDSFDSIRKGNFIHVWTQERTTGRVAYHLLDIARQEWDTVNDEVLASNSDGDVGVSGDVRSDSEEPVCAFMGDQVAAGPCTWGGMTIAGAGDYRRLYYSRLVDGSWTAPALLGSPGSLSATFYPFGLAYNGAVHVNPCRVIAEADDWVRFVFSVEEPADVASNPDLYTQRLAPDNTLTAAWEFEFTGGSTYSPECFVGDPCVFEYLGEHYTVVPAGLVYQPRLYIWQGAGASGDATFEVSLTDETTLVQIQPDSYGTENPTIGVRWFKDKIYVVMGTRIGATEEWAALKTVSPPFEDVVPNNLTDPRDDQAGVVWPNGTYARQGIEFATILGRDYLFKTATGNFGVPDSTKLWILEKIDLADVPTDPSETLAQFLIDNP